MTKLKRIGSGVDVPLLSDEEYVLGVRRRSILVVLWALHLGAGLLLLIIGSAFPNTPVLMLILKWLADLGGAIFPLLETAQACKNVGLLAQAVGSVVFITGHFLLIGYFLNVLTGVAADSSKLDLDAIVAPTFWEAVFWGPSMFALGIGIYWTTYIHMATAGHIICPSNPVVTWFFRIGPTVTAPFVVGMVLGPLFLYGAYVVKFVKFILGRK